MLQLLETFCAVADAGSLSKAAEALHVTQPAVTRQIKALEAQLGAVLLARTPGGVTLTPAGNAVLVHARQALAAVAACRTAAAETAGSGAGSRLRIGSGLMFTMYLLPPVLAKFRERWPAVEIDLHPSHHGGALERLLAYEVDVALIGHDVQLPGARHIRLFEDPVLLVAAPSAGLAPDSNALQGAPLLVMPLDSGLRKETDRALAELGIAPRLVEYPTIETLKTAVMLGMGPAVLPSSAVKAEVDAGRLIACPLEGWPEPARTIRAVVRAEGAVPEPVKNLISMIREHYEAER